MNRQLFSFSLCILFFNSEAQTDNQITIGKIDSIQSMVLNENRKIWIHVPVEGQNSKYLKKRYPVVYLLDGDAHFSSVVGMIQQLSSVNGNMICPEMIVVAIPNTNRTRDLTPTHVDVDPRMMDSVSSKPSGGGEQFISFIEKELMPFIDNRYPTAPYKMLIGHSFGGLLAMQIFVHHTNLFDSYVCIDPSMWWDKQTLLGETKKALAINKFKSTSLFLGIANTMEDGININEVVKDTSNGTRHIRAIMELRNSFESTVQQNGLKYQGKYYNEDSHGSVPLVTEYDALHFFFSFYPLKITSKDYADTTAALADRYQRHFSLVTQQMGYEVKPPENVMNSMGVYALTGKKFKKAEQFFKYNMANYPESFNVYASMGDYYNAMGDKPGATTYFKKALSIKEDADTRKKLEAVLR